MKNDISVDEFLLFAKRCIRKEFTTIKENRPFTIKSVDKGIKMTVSSKNIRPERLQDYLEKASSIEGDDRYKTTTYNDHKHGSHSYFIPILKKFDEEYLIKYSDEINDSGKYTEGAITQSIVNEYDRNPAARNACLKKYGYNCSVCDINFEQKYGEIGRNFIHVHHLIEISSIGKEYEIQPDDLRPVCPNCHVMLHTKKPALTIDELKEIRAQLKNNT